MTAYKILMVTRESGSDRRYGLGKSLAPVIDELRERDADVTYLTQKDAGVRGHRLLRRVHRHLVGYSDGHFPTPNFPRFPGCSGT